MNSVFKKYKIQKSIARDLNPSLLIFEDNVKPKPVAGFLTSPLLLHRTHVWSGGDTSHGAKSNFWKLFTSFFISIIQMKANYRTNPFFLFFPVSCLLLMACEDDKKDIKKEEYKGPVSEVYGINMAYTDSARLVVKMSTEAQLTMANEDKKYPKEVRIFFFDKMGNNTTKLRGDSAIYLKATNLYRIMGRVQINNQVKNEVLETDELFWNPDTKKIYSNKAVDIKTPEQTIHGVGMDSNQDFTEYTIRKISNSQVVVKNLPQ